MFRQVLWSVVLSLTWCDGYLYHINATEELDTTDGKTNCSDPVLLPVFDDSDLSSNVSFHAENATAMYTIEVQTAAQGNLSLNVNDPLASQCQVVTKNQLTVIKSPSFPANYGPNLNCDYTVHRNSSNSCSVTFLFNVLDLEASEGCYKDYVILNEEKLCGYVPSAGVTRVIQFQEPVVVMKFHSDGYGSGLGFLLTAVQQECPPLSCDGNFSSSQFKLTSPNFPSNYNNRQICDYIIAKNSSLVCMLRLQVELFDVEYDDKCEADFFELGGERFCGIMSEGQTEFTSEINCTGESGFTVSCHKINMWIFFVISNLGLAYDHEMI
ncbi:embryonic protein UVS.2-like [Tachypleus tridentatus]|uniref:embryonic protein UVS.2-like n=1 Tax=Tachypleus tridentatus TaxID=6853 RepID=UPI003FD11C82